MIAVGIVLGGCVTRVMDVVCETEFGVSGAFIEGSMNDGDERQRRRANANRASQAKLGFRLRRHAIT
jgi:hypothetical protein